PRCGASGLCDPRRGGCVTVECRTNADCDNGNLCDGTERCETDHCVAGTRISCDDSFSCTVDMCVPATGMCVHTPSDAMCDDHMYCNGVEFCDPMRGCRR